MKAKIHLPALLFCLGMIIPATAQDTIPVPERGSVLPGYVITNEGDTARGHLLNINLWLNQNMTFFYTDPDDRQGRVKYKPKDIRAYQVGPRYYESMKYAFPYSSHKNNFILRKFDGPIKFYVWYYNPDKLNLMDTDISLDDLAKAFLYEEDELSKSGYAIKGDGELTELTSFRFLLKFARNMSEYVKEDPELSRKIAEKTPGYLGIHADIESIVSEYNRHMAN